MSTIAHNRVQVTGGVDTHKDTHTAAAVDAAGRMLGSAQFPATPAGYAALLGWLGGFGQLVLVGVEGTGVYGTACVWTRQLPGATAGRSRWHRTPTRSSGGCSSSTGRSRPANDLTIRSGPERAHPSSPNWSAVERLRWL